jgi:hypothetical protein
LEIIGRDWQEEETFGTFLNPGRDLSLNEKFYRYRVKRFTEFIHVRIGSNKINFETL